MAACQVSSVTCAARGMRRGSPPGIGAGKRSERLPKEGNIQDDSNTGHRSWEGLWCLVGWLDGWLVAWMISWLNEYMNKKKMSK